MTHALGWKRFGGFLILAAMVLCALPHPAIGLGFGQTFVSDGVTYRVLGGGYVAVGDGYRAAVPKDAHDVTIPSVVSTEGATYSVLSIGDSAFNGCSSLTSITIPGSVQVIDGRAFWGCSSLKAIDIPDSVFSVGDEAFGYCSSLTSVTIPPTVTSMGKAVFGDCSSLAEATLPPSITSIPLGTFSGCSSLVTYTIPPWMTSIGSYAFFECTSLATITIPTSVTSIGDSAFFRCRALTSISIPDAVSTIGYSTFWECLSLESIVIPNSVTSIEQGAFVRCSSLRWVTIPNSVTTIDNIAFSECTSLESVTIPSSVTLISGEAFFGCTSLATVVLDVNRPWIEQYAFPPSTRLLTNISSATISGLAVTYAYTGSAVRPTPIVTLAGKTLTSSDYAVSYANDSAVGTGMVFVTGKNGYAGTIAKDFSIIPVATTVALTTKSSPSLAYGSAFVIRGTLKANGAGLAGQPLTLWSGASATSARATSIEVTTGAEGAFSFSVKPTSKTYYVVEYAGSVGYIAPTSNASVYAVPRADVRTPIAPKTMSHSKSYSVYGSLKPRHASGTNPVRIYRYRYVSGHWKSYSYVKAKASNYSSYTKYLVKLRLTTKGKWRVRAYTPADSLHAAAWSSGYDYVTVK